MFTRVPAAEYDGGSALDKLDAEYILVALALGEPHRAEEPGYPDDDYKTDVCWSVRSTDHPDKVVTIWNYKNGPRYNGGEGTVEEISRFSIYYTDFAFWEVIHRHIYSMVQSDVYQARPIKVVDVQSADGEGFMQPFDDWAALLGAEAQVGAQWTIKLIEMTRAEYSALLDLE